MSAKSETYERARSIARSRQLWVPIALLSAVALALTALWFFRPPPLGDCFGGLLNQDPLHCYALEQTEKEGLIDIEKIYDADGVLFFSLRQDGPVGRNVYSFLDAKSSEFYDRWPEHVPYLERDIYSLCLRHLGHSYRQCYLETRLVSSGLPKATGYEDIRFHTGGETARYSRPGWASWQQVWPPGIPGGDGSPLTFDVSDVDMSSFPSFGCPEKVVPPFDVYDGNICSRDFEVAESVVAWRGKYVQYKNPPKDEAALNAIKEIILPCYNKVGPCTWYATTTAIVSSVGRDRKVETNTKVTSESSRAIEMVIIPVKYGPVELAKWAVILDRFALSGGNTIGVTAAEVDFNTKRDEELDPVWPLDSLRPANEDAFGPIKSELRKTIVVWGMNSQRIADALPMLLPLLGIPVDAVGLVLTEWRNGKGYGFDDYHPYDQGPAMSLEWFGTTFTVPAPILMLARNVGRVLVWSAVVLFIIVLAVRLRRNS